MGASCSLHVVIANLLAVLAFGSVGCGAVPSMSGPAPRSGSIYYGDWLDITVHYGGERMIMAEISVEMLRKHMAPVVEIRVSGTWYNVREIDIGKCPLITENIFHEIDISEENKRYRSISDKVFHFDGTTLYFNQGSLVMVHVAPIGGSIRIDRDDNKIIEIPSQRSESPIEQILGPPTKMDVPGLNE